MKKLILITVCCALFTVATYAQDTTRTKTKQSSDQLKKDRSNSEQDLKGWTRLNTTDVPTPLRETLTATEYSGWEDGTLYRNEAGDLYTLRTNDKNNPKTYYFDKNGKVTKRPNNK
jgi:hypothetical protein